MMDGWCGKILTFAMDEWLWIQQSCKLCVTKFTTLLETQSLQLYWIQSCIGVIQQGCGCGLFKFRKRLFIQRGCACGLFKFRKKLFIKYYK